MKQNASILFLCPATLSCFLRQNAHLPNASVITTGPLICVQNTLWNHLIVCLRGSWRFIDHLREPLLRRRGIFHFGFNFTLMYLCENDTVLSYLSLVRCHWILNSSQETSLGVLVWSAVCVTGLSDANRACWALSVCVCACTHIRLPCESLAWILESAINCVRGKTLWQFPMATSTKENLPFCRTGWLLLRVSRPTLRAPGEEGSGSDPGEGSKLHFPSSSLGREGGGQREDMRGWSSGQGRRSSLFFLFSFL